MMITLDGPVASGKSSVADKIAEKLVIPCLHSGLLYRALAYILLHASKRDNAIDMHNLTQKDFPDLTHLAYHYQQGKTDITYKGDSIISFLADTEIGKITSIISAQSVVRKTLYQQFFKPYAQNRDFVAEGRDCGTEVFPHADVKIFLTASVEKRAERLVHDKQRHVASLASAINDIKDRDARDEQREVSPLRPAHDAIIIDSSHLTFEQTIQRCIAVIEEKRK